eukprot:831966_1
MIASMSPTDFSYEDSLNTLKYANRAKNIKTKVSRNVLQVDYHISQYTNIINDLKKEVSDLKMQLRRSQQQVVPKPVSGLAALGYAVANMTTLSREQLSSVRNEMMDMIGAIMHVQKAILDVDELCMTQQGRISRLMEQQQALLMNSEDEKSDEIQNFSVELHNTKSSHEAQIKSKRLLKKKLQQMRTIFARFPA